MRFGKWNVRSLYRLGSLTAAARELIRYKLNLVGVREVRWDKEEWIIILLWKRKQKSSISNRIFLYPTEVSAVKGVELLATGCYT